MRTDELHPDLSGPRVLMVEDERLIALDIQDILEGWGCTVAGPVASASAALQIIKEDCPDAAFLDVHLNGGTSEPVADALRAHGHPFLVLTAYQQSHLIGAFRDAPLLRKPVNEKKLLQELSALLPASSRD